MANGESKPMTPEDYDDFLRNVIEPMAGDGLRTICIAYKDFDHLPEDWNDESNIIDGLTCVCLCGIEDPIRPEVDSLKEVLFACIDLDWLGSWSDRAMSRSRYRRADGHRR